MAAKQSAQALRAIKTLNEMDDRRIKDIRPLIPPQVRLGPTYGKNEDG